MKIGIIVSVAAFLLVTFFVFACAHAPIPDGGSIQETDSGGIVACLDFARKSGCTCPKDAGPAPKPTPQFVDASVGK